MRIDLPMILLSLIASLTVLTGCGQHAVDRVERQPAGRLLTAEELNPGHLAFQNARLILGGTEVPVRLEAQQERNRFKVSVLAKGAVVEVEDYVIDDRTFRFSGVGGETFSPPITLLTFPMRSIGEWTWGGTIVSDPISRAAQATITSTDETINTPAGQFEAVKVEVLLAIDAGAPSPAQRKLTFWFVPQKGLIKREFGASSTRIPVPNPAGP